MARWSARFVLDGGRLGGNGTVGTTTVGSGGTIAPGNSIGTLHVAGNATIGAGRSIRWKSMRRARATSSRPPARSRLGGGEVVVLDAPGSYAAGTSYTIITAAGGVSGAFDGVTDSLPLLDAVLSYLPVGVLLTLEENAQLIAALGITPNQRATGAGIDSLGGGVWRPHCRALALLTSRLRLTCCRARSMPRSRAPHRGEPLPQRGSVQPHPLGLRRRRRTEAAGVGL